jgi:hypothetical protein
MKKLDFISSLLGKYIPRSLRMGGLDSGFAMLGACAKVIPCHRSFVLTMEALNAMFHLADEWCVLSSLHASAIKF